MHLTTEATLKGKTIATLRVPKDAHQDLWIKFTDGSYVVFHIHDIGTGFNNHDVIGIREWEPTTDEELVTLGIITEAERQLRLQREEEEWQRKLTERDAQYQSQVEALERKQLASLQAKYKS